MTTPWFGAHVVVRYGGVAFPCTIAVPDGPDAEERVRICARVIAAIHFGGVK